MLITLFCDTVFLSSLQLYVMGLAVNNTFLTKSKDKVLIKT